MKVAIYTRVSGKSNRQDAANQSVTVDRILPSVKAGKDTRNKRHTVSIRPPFAGFSGCWGVT